MRIGLDILGGDYAPQATVGGAVLAKKELPSDVTLVLIGDQSQIEAELAKVGGSVSDFEIVHTTDCIGMGEHPTRAFTQKPNSSIGIGFKLLKEGKIDSFASTGNTGAMLVGAMYTVKAVPGVIRPCILSILPKFKGGFGLILDVGTNADCKPDVLYQFGIIGNIYAKHILKIENPKVGLMNIGEEEEKGNLVSQAAHGLMKDSRDFNFIGNVEGRDLFNEKADVVVCDGFTGNVILKQAESFYRMIKKRGINDDYFERFNYEDYGGSPILGVNANVIIGHGISNDKAIKSMLLLSKEVVDQKLADKIKNAFQYTQSVV